jgi:hypothetical protein
MSSTSTLTSAHKPVSHTVAASGDTIITLNKPNPQLAIWEYDSSLNPATSTSAAITFRVSSRHLIEASPLFQAAMTGGWKEGSKNNDGFYEIIAEGWDAEALHIVLIEIHGDATSVTQPPRVVDLELLGKIAVLVDYYNLYHLENLYPQAEKWIKDLQGSFKTAFGQNELILWL